MALDPSTLLQEAVKAVPAVKYALGIAGILAVLAIAKAFDLAPAFAVGGTVVVLALMVVLLVFAKLSASASRHFVAPALFLTWGSLALVLASAGMLFTSAFFGSPIDLRPAASEPAVGTGSRPPNDVGSSEVADLVSMQLDARDYAGAWAALREERTRRPDAPELDDLEVRVAEAWVRDMRHGEGETFTALVDPLLPALYRAARSKDKQTAADALAHIGFASFLKNRDGAPRLDPEASYRKALELDPGNPYANAMLGHWLLFGRKPAAAAQPYFEAALASGREREFVRQRQIVALIDGDEATSLALLRVCNEMRQKDEPLRLETRRRIVSRTYYGVSREQRDALETVLPPKEHLATLRWLVEGTDLREVPYVRIFQAQLHEAAGDCAAALPLYETLAQSDTVFTELIQAGLARCKKLASPAAQ